MSMRWVDYFLAIAEVAKLKSKDKNTQIGAVIIGPEYQIISTGYNSFPRGINDDKPDRQVAPEKYYFMVHAELNAIVNAALNGVSTKDTTMFSTAGIPCCTCTQAIINAGIRILWIKETCTTKGERWVQEQARSIVMLLEAGVAVNYYD